jgi:hypothetical protein
VNEIENQITTLAQSIGLDEERTRKLVAFTTNRLAQEPSMVRRVMTAVLTAFGALVVGAGFIGLLATKFDIEEQLPLFLIIGFAFFPGAFFCLSSRQETVGVTLMLIGLIASGIVASADLDSQPIEIFLFPVWLIIAAFALMNMRNTGAIFTAAAVVEAYLLIFLIGQLDSAAAGLSVAVICNTLAALLMRLPPGAMPSRLSARIRPVLYGATILAATLFAFVLTFEGIYQDLSAGEEAMLTLYNLLFFATTGAMVWFGKQRSSSLLMGIGGVFWFAFLVYKYYDLLWNLLHKSITLILLGVLCIGIAYALRTRDTGTSTT